MKKRTALLQTLREIFRRHRSQPVKWVVEHINPILRGWVNYFAIGYSSRCFQFVKRWVEVKVRRHLMRARKRWGLGWVPMEYAMAARKSGAVYRLPIAARRAGKSSRSNRSHKPWHEASR